MKVKCIDSSEGAEDLLTIGQIYEVAGVIEYCPLATADLPFHGNYRLVGLGRSGFSPKRFTEVE